MQPAAIRHLVAYSLNLNGVFIVPLVFLTIGVLAGIPGDGRLLVLALLLFGLAGAAVLVAVQWPTFER